MARPPRIPVWLLWDQRVIYFLTICVEDRRRVLDNSRTFDSFKKTIEALDQWHLSAAVLMPDHLHILVAPQDREASIKQFSKLLKRLWRMDLAAEWKFQDGCFDRLLRKEESAQQKWYYMRENPVRAGLVTRWEDWPYSINLLPPEAT